MFLAGCSSSNKEVFLLVEGKETPSCPYQTQTFHPMDNSPLFPLHRTAAFLQAVAIRLRTLHSWRPVVQCLTFTIPLISCSCYREGSQVFQTGANWVALGLGGPYQKSFISSSHLSFPNMLWKSTLQGIRHSWLLRSNFHAFIASFHTRVTCSQCSTLIPRSVYGSSWTCTKREKPSVQTTFCLLGP